MAEVDDYLSKLNYDFDWKTSDFFSLMEEFELAEFVLRNTKNWWVKNEENRQYFRGYSKIKIKAYLNLIGQFENDRFARELLKKDLRVWVKISEYFETEEETDPKYGQALIKFSFIDHRLFPELKDKNDTKPFSRFERDFFKFVITKKDMARIYKEKLEKMENDYLTRSYYEVENRQSTDKLTSSIHLALMSLANDINYLISYCEE